MLRELQYNQGVREKALAVLRADHVIWPLFETFGSEVLSTSEALDVLETGLLDDLLRVYNRLRSANVLMDEFRVETSEITTANRIGLANPQRLPPLILDAQRALRDLIVDRLMELEGWLDGVVEQLEEKTAA